MSSILGDQENFDMICHDYTFLGLELIYNGPTFNPPGR